MKIKLTAEFVNECFVACRNDSIAGRFKQVDGEPTLQAFQRWFKLHRGASLLHHGGPGAYSASLPTHAETVQWKLTWL